MPRIAKKLSHRAVLKLTPRDHRGNTMYAVGGATGLYVQITKSGAKTWILRIKVNGRRRDFGLGSCSKVSLHEARAIAGQMRRELTGCFTLLNLNHHSIPQEIPKNQKGIKFSDAVSIYLGVKTKEFRNEKHKQQWRKTLETYAVPIIGEIDISRIKVDHVLSVLTQPTEKYRENGTDIFWLSRTETAARIRGRIECVLAWGTAMGYRTGENPARWSGNLKELLPAPAKIKMENHHPALSLTDAPIWFNHLQGCVGIVARALEFLAMTVVRTGEVRMMTWDELHINRFTKNDGFESENLDAYQGHLESLLGTRNVIWLIPQNRTKAGREHRVPLPSRAVELLEKIPKKDGVPYVFSNRNNATISETSLNALMRRMAADANKRRPTGDNTRKPYVDERCKRTAVPHGLRSTFRDWVSERTSFPGELAEIALAHKISSKTEAAYRRGDMLLKREYMMNSWVRFLEGRPDE